MLDESPGKPPKNGLSGLLRDARNDGEKSYFSKIWRRSVWYNLTISKLEWYGHVFFSKHKCRDILGECQIDLFNSL